jgi:hypothetical protein
VKPVCGTGRPGESEAERDIMDPIGLVRLAAAINDDLGGCYHSPA